MDGCGFQVDISTMLEEAVQYVKFLQLQIKVGPLKILVPVLLVPSLPNASNTAHAIFSLLAAAEFGRYVDVCPDRL
jgi:hypothetical protein